MPKVISIHSYRGGTGKSNFTANLATTIAAQGYRVAVVDTDLPSPGIHNLFGVDNIAVANTLNHFLWGESAIEDVVYEVGNNIGLKGTGKLYLLPASVKADDIARILKNGYDVRIMNDGFRQLVKSLALDYLFIDTHPGLSKETFLSIAISHVLVLLLRPDKQDYQGTAVTIDVARQLKVKQVLLAINKVYSKLNFEELRKKVEDTYDETVAGIFPFSEEMIELASEGVFCLKFPDHPLSQEFRRVAQAIQEI